MADVVGNILQGSGQPMPDQGAPTGSNQGGSVLRDETPDGSARFDKRVKGLINERDDWKSRYFEMKGQLEQKVSAL